MELTEESRAYFRGDQRHLRKIGSISSASACIQPVLREQWPYSGLRFCNDGRAYGTRRREHESMDRGRRIDTARNPPSVKHTQARVR